MSALTLKALTPGLVQLHEHTAHREDRVLISYSNCDGQAQLLCLRLTTPTFANSIDPDQMASEEAI